MAFLLPDAVLEAARRFPDRLAISDGSASCTYAELEERTRHVAAALHAAGLQPGDRVGVLAKKSVECVVAMLGASRAGACYVPVDPRAPAARSTYVLSNAEVEFLITEARLVQHLGLEPGHEGIPPRERIFLVDPEQPEGYPLGASTVPTVDHFEAPAVNEFDPAYILYTSGSTGNPKGVVISHRNALTFVDWGRDTFDLKPDDRLSNHAPFHFDLSVFDLYGALTTGASVHLIPDMVAPFPAELARWIEETGITVWYSVPSALVRLLLHGDTGRFEYRALRTILFAGEVFPVRHLRSVMDVFAEADFFNLYGPTETNVCTWYPVPRPLPSDDADIPIGKACANMEAIAVTAEGSRCAPGEEGELVVRGPCVMLGYWGLMERTAKSIIQNPLHDLFLDPVYRTGDWVRATEGGDFEFIGRRDHMVKVRGYRVELGEIENALHAFEGVREAAVVTIPDDEVGNRLYAATVAEDGVSLDEADVRKHCLERLLRYAVPEGVFVLDELPRTSTGKADRVGLTATIQSRLDAQQRENP